MRAILLLTALFACSPDDVGSKPRPLIDTSTDTDTDTDEPTGPCGSDLDADQHGTNVLFILIDDVGNDKIGAYGEHPEPATTPNIDSLAAEGMLFRNAYSYNLCSPTRAAAMTGRYGQRTGVGAVLTWGFTTYDLPLREVTIPEMLDRSPFSYDSAAIGKWHLVVQTAVDPNNDPNNQGFNWFQGTLSNLVAEILNDPQENDYYHWEKVENGVAEYSDVYNTTDIVDDTLAHLPQMSEPWFVYLPIHAAHGPWNAPPPDLVTVEGVDESSPDIDKWHATLEAADTEIGRLLDNMDPAVRARTTVVIMADNGTKTNWILEPWTKAGRGKGTMFESGINVPLIVNGPLVAQPGSESAALVHTVDVFSTVAEIACVDQETMVRDDGSEVIIDGQSLIPFLLDPDAEGRDFLYTEAFAPVGNPDHWSRDERVYLNTQYKLVEDWITGIDKFYEFVPGAYEEGDDLFATGLTDDQQAGYDLLKSELADFHSTLVPEYYDY